MGRGEESLLYGQTTLLQKKRKTSSSFKEIPLSTEGLGFIRGEEGVAVIDKKGQIVSLASGNPERFLEESSSLTTCQKTAAAFRKKDIDNGTRLTISVARGQSRFLLEASVIPEGSRIEDLSLQALDDKILLYDQRQEKLFSYLLPEKTGQKTTILNPDLWQERSRSVVAFSPGEKGALLGEEDERSLRTTYIDAAGQEHTFFYWGDNNIKNELSSYLHAPAGKPEEIYLTHSNRLTLLNYKSLDSSTFAHLPEEPVKLISRGHWLAILYQNGFDLFHKKQLLARRQGIGATDISFEDEDLLLLAGEGVVRHKGLLATNKQGDT